LQQVWAKISEFLEVTESMTATMHIYHHFVGSNVWVKTFSKTAKILFWCKLVVWGTYQMSKVSLSLKNVYQSTGFTVSNFEYLKATNSSFLILFLQLRFLKRWWVWHKAEAEVGEEPPPVKEAKTSVVAWGGGGPWVISVVVCFGGVVWFFVVIFFAVWCVGFFCVSFRKGHLNSWDFIWSFTMCIALSSICNNPFDLCIVVQIFPQYCRWNTINISNTWTI